MAHIVPAKHLSEGVELERWDLGVSSKPDISLCMWRRQQMRWFFTENETVLQKRSPFTPTTTELTLTPGHRTSTPGTAWLLTQQSASWTNITWIQFSCNHFPSSIHCAQLVPRHFALAKNCELFFLFIFLTIPNPLPPSRQKNSPIIRNNSSSCKHESWNGDSYRKTKKCASNS